ncbi:hypothetical protein HDU91_003262 [Kappamyces sp. JEL0680]|nr:hypothetical protein HDU91_003262 [Kappamyces sp. JEL0680]
MATWLAVMAGIQALNCLSNHKSKHVEECINFANIIVTCVATAAVWQSGSSTCAVEAPQLRFVVAAICLSNWFYMSIYSTISLNVMTQFLGTFDSRSSTINHLILSVVLEAPLFVGFTVSLLLEARQLDEHQRQLCSWTAPSHVPLLSLVYFEIGYLIVRSVVTIVERAVLYSLWQRDALVRHATGFAVYLVELPLSVVHVLVHITIFALVFADYSTSSTLNCAQAAPGLTKQLQIWSVVWIVHAISLILLFGMLHAVVTVMGPSSAVSRGAAYLLQAWQMQSTIAAMSKNGAKLSAIEKLPLVKFKKPLNGQTSRNNQFAEDTCAVCAEQFQENTRLRKLPCGHLFHRDCSTNWLLIKAECPSCRRKVELAS